MTQRAGRTLIVNADDLGRSPAVDEGIFEAHREGIVTSATLMVGFATDQTGRRLRDVPDLGVGLHVTLTGTTPTLPAEQLPSLVDAEGRLPRNRPQLRELNLHRAEVLAEMRHQLERFHDLTGREPTHLDGHHHCLRVPVVLDAFVELALEHRLPVRRASPEVARRLGESGIPTTDAFIEHFYGDDVRPEVLREILVSLPDGVSEVMCHPGRVDDFLRSGSTYTDERELELQLLTDPELPGILAQHGIRLSHFGNLCASRG